MGSGDEGRGEAEGGAESVAQEGADVTRAAIGDAAAQMQTATAAVAEQAETANREGARAASAAASTTSEAFGAARDRLNAMSQSVPSAGQDFFRPFQVGGGDIGKGLESSFANTMQGMAEFNSKAIAAWRNNAESMVRHWQSLASVKSVSEALALNAEHTRAQLDAVTAQTRELSTLATRIMRGAADPLKTTGR